MPDIEERLTTLVCTDTTARDIYELGFLNGHLAGQAFVTADREQAARDAAAQFYAMEQWQADYGHLSHQAAEWVDVLRARAGENP